MLGLFLANRSLPLSLGFTSMTATWVGAGYINGTAEAVFNDGLVWCQAPLGYALSLVIGGLFFAGRMHATKAFTMLDPFQKHYGCWIGILLCVPAVSGEVFWTASNLSALGETLYAVTHLNITLIIVVSTCVILLYTSKGGLASVLYTDVFQLCSTVMGLWCCVPFIARYGAEAKISEAQKDWVGVIGNNDLSRIIDQLLMAIFGGIPWQVYFQRVLSADSAFTAKMLSFLSAVGCVFLSLPPVIVGASGKSANFTAAGYPGPYNLEMAHRKDIMPYAIRYLTPGVISILGQLAITAAVMSSVDSSMLSASSLITRNVYQLMFRPMATEEELCAALRCTLWVVGLLSMAMALNVQSVFALWVLSSDLVYVLLFPQFIVLFFMPSKINAYGAVAGFAIGLITRALCGEPQIGIPVMLRLPLYDEQRGQQFPFRTLCMLLSLACVLGGSAFAAYLFRSGRLEAQQDVWGCFQEPSNVAAQTARSGFSTNAPSNVAAGHSLSAAASAQAAGTRPHGGGQEVTDRESTGEQRREHADRSSGLSRAASDDKEKSTSQAAHTSHRHQRKLSGALAEQDFILEGPRNRRIQSSDPESKPSGSHGVESSKVVRRKELGASEAEPKGARMPVRRQSVQGEHRARMQGRRQSVVGDEDRVLTANDKQSAAVGAAPMKSERPLAHHDAGSSGSKRHSDRDLKESGHSAKSTTTPSGKNKERKDGTTPSKSARAKKHK
ncbi:high-affinity choline transporter 1 [Rhipicephalus sanguineus]|uniref:high-affinity choline transporter 1 n=1 Tax=Rhipicephalus sanguineus TaxID=34632 RepID=UPI0020C59F0B|nr:high-affinity choline transporter 1 [Rhipicephalus sanguineus]